MLVSWLELVDSVLQPSRPRLQRCLGEREPHLAARRRVAEERAREIADCEQRIEKARTAVFAAKDGVVTSQMTDLEREWRLLSRRDPDGGLMDLWARIAPPAWIDRKRWRDSEPAGRLDAAIALAADPDGVDSAETAITALRGALAPWEGRVGSRIRWQTSAHDTATVEGLLTRPLQAARKVLEERGHAPVVLDRARRLDHDVRHAASRRLSGRTALPLDLGHAAFVDTVWRAVADAFADRPNPVTPLRELWTTGYLLASADEHGVTLEMPPLEPT